MQKQHNLKSKLDQTLISLPEYEMKDIMNYLTNETEYPYESYDLKDKNLKNKSLLQFILRNKNQKSFINRVLKNFLLKKQVIGTEAYEAGENSFFYEKYGYRSGFYLLKKDKEKIESNIKYNQQLLEIIDMIKIEKDSRTIQEAGSLMINLDNFHLNLLNRKDSLLLNDFDQKLYPLIEKSIQNQSKLSILNPINENIYNYISILIERNMLTNWTGLELTIDSTSKFRFEYIQNILKQTQQKISIRLIGNENHSLNKQDYFNQYLNFAEYLKNKENIKIVPYTTHKDIIMKFISNDKDTYEFQTLYGLPEGMYKDITQHGSRGEPVRIIAPIGTSNMVEEFLFLKNQIFN